MEITIGIKIRELRLQHHRTQTEMADTLGVSPQAVSRWEIGLAYPDMELLPSIANYFGVSIDCLFGYQSDRESKIESIIKEADELSRYDNGVDVNIEKRLTILRNGLAEFPGNEKLMYELAATLSTAGWVRLGEHIRYDENGYLVHDIEKHHENEYWNESIKLFETILSQSRDSAILTDSVYNLTLLYCNMGEYEKSLALADKMPQLHYSRELMRVYSSDGINAHRYLGKALTELADEFALIMVQTLMSKQSFFEDDLAIRMLTGTINIFELLFEDGNMGAYHSRMVDLFLYLSEHQWRCGMHNEAFESLDNALKHAVALRRISRTAEEEPKYTCELLKDISMEKSHWGTDETLASTLPKHWPMWMKPDFEDILNEISADPRWEDWVRRCESI